MSALPDGWVRSTLDDVTLPIETTDPRRSPEKEFVYIDIGSIDNQTQTITNPKYILGQDAPSRARRIVAVGDVLFSTVRTYLKNIAIVADELDGELTSTGITVLRPSEAIESRYLFNFVRSDKFINEISKSQDGTLYPAVKDKVVRGAIVPLPPLEEQKRIVERIDNLTARTNRAKGELSRVPALVAKYKEALLDLAFSGRLTMDWRSNHPNELPAPLDTVRKLRSEDRLLSKRKEVARKPQQPIPSSWLWISPDEAASDERYAIGIGPFGSDLLRGDYRDNGVRLVFVRDIRRERFDSDDAHYVDNKKAQELHRHVARPGDVLITKMGDPPGDSCLFPLEEEPAVITADCIKLTPHPALVTPEFLNFAIRSRQVQSQIKLITAGVAQQKVSLGRFRRIALPIPPLAEQNEITLRINTAFTWLERVSVDHANVSELLPKLDGAILAKAFRGELAPQSPDDEPADLMLERVKVELAAKLLSDRTQDLQMRVEELEERVLTLERNLERVLIAADDWLPAQTAFQRCGIGDGASTEDIEHVYAQLRELERAGRLEAKAVTDKVGRKLYDSIRLRAV